MAAKRILLFGLSGNPPTGKGGHLSLVSYFVQNSTKKNKSEGCRWDEVWVMPVYSHMYSSKKNMLAFEHRLEMCRLCFEPAGSPDCPVIVSTIEKEVFEDKAKQATDQAAVRVGTYDIICFLKKKYPNSEFGFLMGTDTFNDLCSGKWRRSAELKEMLEFEVFQRPGEPPLRAPGGGGGGGGGGGAPRVWRGHTPPDLRDVSSTQARALASSAAAAGDGELARLVAPAVAGYIARHGLYRKPGPPARAAPPTWAARGAAAAAAAGVAVLGAVLVVCARLIFPPYGC